MTDTTVIILSYNTCKLVMQCLRSFYSKVITSGWQVILVDNGSTDTTVEAVGEAYPGVEILKNEQNRGYGAGNNVGLRHARGRAIILLNSDVIISAEALFALVQDLENSPSIGAVSAGLVTRDGEPQAFAYGDDPDPAYLLQRSLRRLSGRGSMHNWAIQKPVTVDWVSGACLCVRGDALRQVGLFDERFFLYFEDNDLCLRMRQAGWQIVYDPQVKAIHLGGASLPQRSKANRLYYRSMELFYAKHYGFIAAACLRLGVSIYRKLVRQ